jgi:hypothetical protein
MSRRCRGCYQNVELHSGCSVGRAVVMGVTFERVRWQAVDGRRCPDCSTIANGYHHLVSMQSSGAMGCPQEECPVCGLRLGVSQGSSREAGRRSCGCGRLGVTARPRGAEEAYELQFGRDKIVDGEAGAGLGRRR